MERLYNYNITDDKHWNEMLNILLDPSVSEITTNGPDSFFIKKNGRRIHIDSIKMTPDEYFDGIEYGLVNPKIMRSYGVFDKEVSLYEGILDFTKEGKRVRARCHIVLPPASTYAPQVTIAKKSVTLNSLDSIAAMGSMSTEMKNFLEAAVQADLTIVFSGGTGAGKNLHKDTLIPTPKGLKKLSSIKVGDRVYDEMNNESKVVKKHSPLEKRFFEISFSNGEKVKAGAGHIWKVRDSYDPYRFSKIELSDDKKMNIVKNLADHKEDEFITLHEILEIVGLSPLHAVKLQHIISGFARKGEEVIALKKNDILSRVHKDGKVFEMVNEMPEEIPLAEVINNSEIDILEVFGKEMSDEIKSVADRLFYNRRETLDYILKEDSSESKMRSAIATTEEIFEAMDENDEDREVSIDIRDQEDTHHKYVNNGSVEIVSIVEIEGKSGDYICIGIDSDSHMFLCTESRIPTHNTTMMEAVTKEIDHEFRIGIAEDLPELELIQPNVSYLQSVPLSPGMDAKKVVTLEWVIQQFQRMRTDKLLVGEIRGKEFASFLVAANSGMDGSMTTMHADNPKLCLNKMSSFTQSGMPGTPLRMVNQNIANSVDIIVQLTKYKHKHRVSHIEEVTRSVGSTEDAKISSASLYRWDSERDMFAKTANISDELRERMKLKNIDVSQFLASRTNELQSAHIARPELHSVDTPMSSQSNSESSGFKKKRENPFGGGKRSI